MTAFLLDFIIITYERLIFFYFTSFQKSDEKNVWNSEKSLKFSMSKSSEAQSPKKSDKI